MSRGAPLCIKNLTKNFLCPGAEVCTSNYMECERINEKECDAKASKAFKCFDDSDSCVSDVKTECCTDPEKAYYCAYD